MKSAARAAWAVWLILCAGCGSGKETMRVWGDVAYAGKPIQQGEIVFTPVDGASGPVTGVPIVDGSYDVPAAKGPLAGGTYRVAINGYAKAGRKIESAPGVFVDALDNFVPDVYNINTTLQVTISSKASDNRFDFGLKAK